MNEQELKEYIFEARKLFLKQMDDILKVYTSTIMKGMMVYENSHRDIPKRPMDSSHQSGLRDCDTGSGRKL